MQRKVKLAPAALASALVLAACSGGSEATPSTNPSTTLTSTPASSTSSSSTSSSSTSSGSTSSGSMSTAPSSVASSSDSATSVSADSAASATPQTTNDASAAIAEMTNAFLATLTDEQKSAVQFDFTDSAQRANWSNLPPRMFPRAGVEWGNLSEESQNAWLAVMQTTLSEEGYEQVIGEWHADGQLKGPDYGTDFYYIAIIGTPSATDAWQWQFGGHHVTVNATLKGPDISLTPSFIGVQPATYDADGNEVRPLGAIIDQAFELVQSLDATQSSAAVISDQKMDLVLGPGQDGKTIANEGVKGSDLTDEQKASLLKLIGHYGNLVNAEDGAARMADLQSHLDDTYFAWAGSTKVDDGIYFRVTGPTIVIEYSGQDMGGNPADHIHGMYRDPTNDYGAAFGAGLS